MSKMAKIGIVQRGPPSSKGSAYLHPLLLRQKFTCLFFGNTFKNARIGWGKEPSVVTFSDLYINLDFSLQLRGDVRCKKGKAMLAVASTAFAGTQGTQTCKTTKRLLPLCWLWHIAGHKPVSSCPVMPMSCNAKILNTNAKTAASYPLMLPHTEICCDSHQMWNLSHPF